MTKSISSAGIILIFLSLSYCIEGDPQSAFVSSPPSLSSVSSSAKGEAGVSENADDKYGNSRERHLVGMNAAGRSRGLNRFSDEPIRSRRSASSMNGRLQRRLDFADVPDVGLLYGRRTSRVLYPPGNFKNAYDSGYETALDNPNEQATGVGSGKDPNGLFGWSNPGGIGEDEPSRIWKTYQELSFLNEANNPDLAHHTETKRKWKSKNMAMWG